MPKTKCEHGRRKTLCRLCGGGSLCEHKVPRTQCRTCEGTSSRPPEGDRTPLRGYCIHYKQKSQCRMCGGGSICPHDKVRSYCVLCRGGGLCQPRSGRQHDVRRTHCRLCGSDFCEHSVQKLLCSRCKELSSVIPVVAIPVDYVTIDDSLGAVDVPTRYPKRMRSEKV